MVKALMIDVYRNNSFAGCSNSGISEKFDKLFIACRNGPFEVEETDPKLCKIVKRTIGERDVYHIEPVAKQNYSFGGAFGYSSDTRFYEMCGRQYGAICIHDRVE